MTSMALRQSALRVRGTMLQTAVHRTTALSARAGGLAQQQRTLTIASRGSARASSRHTSPFLSSTRQSAVALPAYGSSFAAATVASRSLSLWPFGKSSASSELPDAQSSDDAASAYKSGASLPSSQGGETLVPEFPSSPSAELGDLAAAAAAHAQDSIELATAHVNTLEHLGKLSWWPNVNACQAMLDWLVEASGMPWWLTIAAVTLSVRVLVSPLVLYGQKNAIRMANIQPRMQAHMNDIQYAKTTGDQALLAKSVQSVQQLMRDNNCHPMRSLVTPIVQAPLFMTFFFALRGLGEAGLESMKTGGLSWFTDLSAADPYLILPVASSAIMLATIETGAEMGTAGGQAQNTAQAKTMRWVLRGLAVAIIPLTYHFPAAVFCYWTTNGVISLLQLVLLNTPFIRQWLNLPQRVQHPEEEQKLRQYRKGEKEMGFWDAVGTGVTSQQPASQVRVVRRNQAPSVLQSQRGLDDGRERALKKLQDAEAAKTKAPSPTNKQK